MTTQALRRRLARLEADAAMADPLLVLIERPDALEPQEEFRERARLVLAHVVAGNPGAWGAVVVRQ